MNENLHKCFAKFRLKIIILTSLSKKSLFSHDLNVNLFMEIFLENDSKKMFQTEE